VPATSAQFNFLAGLAVDALGILYIADEGTGSGIRKVALDGTISTSASGYRPHGLAIDKAGNLYFASGSVVYMLSPGGIITTVAGGGTSSEDGIPATSAQLANPTGLAVDGNGNLFISDAMLPDLFIPAGSAGKLIGHRIRVVTPSGIITTIAGTGVFGFNGDGGLATSAQFAFPAGIAVDSAANIYVADLLNHRIRKLTPDSKIQLKIDSGNLQSAVVGPSLQFLSRSNCSVVLAPACPTARSTSKWLPVRHLSALRPQRPDRTGGRPWPLLSETPLAQSR
jgi:DNA-binding beta-propeller fold protein YncE